MTRNVATVIFWRRDVENPSRNIAKCREVYFSSSRHHFFVAKLKFTSRHFATFRDKFSTSRLFAMFRDVFSTSRRQKITVATFRHQFRDGRFWRREVQNPSRHFAMFREENIDVATFRDVSRLFATSRHSDTRRDASNSQTCVCYLLGTQELFCHSRKV